jgi:probable addiction module antidote protein
MIQIHQTEHYARWFESPGTEPPGPDRHSDTPLVAWQSGDVKSVSVFLSCASTTAGLPGLFLQRDTHIVLLAGGQSSQSRDIGLAMELSDRLGKSAIGATRSWDAADHLETQEDVVAYLEAAEDGDPALIAAALGDIARAKGMSQIAREAGLGRESLYKALSPEGNPEFATIIKVVHALGLRLHAGPSVLKTAG